MARSSINRGGKDGISAPPIDQHRYDQDSKYLLETGVNMVFLQEENRSGDKEGEASQ